VRARDGLYLQEGEPWFFFKSDSDNSTRNTEAAFSPKSLYLSAKLHGVLFQTMHIIFSLYIPL
jgi:hypothetical protein